jgi:hypothetical protein
VTPLLQPQEGVDDAGI